MTVGDRQFEGKALAVKADEMLPEVITPASAPMKLDQMSKMIGYMEEFVQKLLKTSVDFGLIPGTKRPTLYKAGAEKLCMAFGLSEEYEIIASQRDPFKEWDYTVDGETKKTRGYYYFSARCNLIHKGTGIVWASQIGDCESTERGRETAPSNTILKMAQKRAFVGATLHATFTSDRFTADMDTYARPAPKGQPEKSAATPSGEIPKPLRSMKSKFGSGEKLSKCNFCGNYHIIKDNPVVQHPGTGVENDDLKEKWGHADCYAATFSETKPDPDDKPEPEQSPDPAREALLKEIPELEAELSGLSAEAFKPKQARGSALGFEDITRSNDQDLIDYWTSLKSAIEIAKSAA